MVNPTRPRPNSALPIVAELGGDWELSLGADNKAPATITGYTTGVRQFAEYLDAQGMPSAPSSPGASLQWWRRRVERPSQRVLSTCRSPDMDADRSGRVIDGAQDGHPCQGDSNCGL
jgi:hypothetical protein